MKRLSSYDDIMSRETPAAETVAEKNSSGTTPANATNGTTPAPADGKSLAPLPTLPDGYDKRALCVDVDGKKYTDPIFTGAYASQIAVNLGTISSNIFKLHIMPLAKTDDLDGLPQIAIENRLNKMNNVAHRLANRKNSTKFIAEFMRVATDKVSDSDDFVALGDHLEAIYNHLPSKVG